VAGVPCAPGLASGLDTNVHNVAVPSAHAPSQGRSGSVALFLGGLALRPQLLIIGPLLPLIRVDLGISHAAAGLLATIPILCMGLFAVPAPLASHWLGTRRAIGACILVLGCAGILRALAPNEPLIILLTVPLGVGMGLGGALLPLLVRERFATRPASATGMYTNGFQFGSAVVSALAVPTALLLGGWRAALVALSVGIVAISAAWFWLTSADPARHGGAAPRLVAWPLRNPLVWALALLFGLRSTVFQGLAAWLPTVYVERGWSESTAALLIFVINVVSLPVTAGGMWLADRLGSRRTYLGLGSAALVVSLAGLVVMPEPGLLWALAIGASLGILFPMTMTLPLDLARRPAEVGPISSMMFGVGYLIAAASPVVLGSIRDITGGFTGALAVLVGVAIVLAVITLSFSPARLAPIGPGEPGGPVL
jgi:CP family cyanate transporter-like MFS transporter